LGKVRAADVRKKRETKSWAFTEEEVRGKGLIKTRMYRRCKELERGTWRE